MNIGFQKARALLALACFTFAHADDFPEIYNSEKDQSANPPAPAEAAASFEVPEGFQTTVFAAEPDVQNPIAMAWDHKGRMWVAENYTYAETAKRFDLSLRDRIIILEDKDHDGHAETRKVFSENLQMLTSVETSPDGVWALCPPQLLFIPDANNDDVPDSEPQVILDGFTVAQNNYHNLANGLRWGPDGWLYGRCGGSCPGKVGLPGTADDQRVPIEGGIWRFHPTRKTFEVLCHGTTNPWGHDWDEHGELFFINTVNGHLWHMIPGAHFDRPFAPSPNKLVYEPIQMHADHWHFDRNGKWTDSRDGKANDFGGGHAHIGMCIYQGGLLPDSWNGKLLTWNQHGKRLNVEKLNRHGSGYLASHEPDQLISGDLWFRGLEISAGPDGALYALDWSDTGECHDHTGVHRTSGRIYRFSNGTPPKPDLDLLQNIDAKKLTKIIQHKNVWYERQARLLIKPTPELIAAANELLKAENTVTQLRALWTLNAMGAAKPETLLSHQNEHVRAWAIRLLTDHLPIDHVYGLHPDHQAHANFIPMLRPLARKDQSALVRLTLASTTQRLPLMDRGLLPLDLVTRDDATDHNIPKLLWFGLAPYVGNHPEGLIRIAEATNWPDLLRYISRAMASQPDALIDLAIAQPDKAPHILQGLNEGFKGWRKAPLPQNWNAAVETLSGKNPKLIRELSALFGDGRAMDSLRKIALDDSAAFETRQTALQGLIDARPDDLRALCEKLLNVRYLNKTAIRGLATFDDPALATLLLKKYPNLRPDEKQTIIDVVVARPTWSNLLLTEIKNQKISRTDLTPFHARQILALNDEKLSARLQEIWGDLRQSDDAKKKRIAALHLALTEDVRAKADLSAGRLHFQNLCSSCHLLYGEGGRLGPDLTGSGRADLGYLLENIVDPSAIVPAEYRMNILKLKDGRSLAGVIASQTDRTLTLRSLTEEFTLEKSEVTETQTLPNSIMPEGLLNALTPEQTRDLIAYLMHPQQVPLKK
ncbi:MAG: c-type cytochrome [Akkermansiaceae bacterium]|jgi:putative membrane-bound dehydrogenase-like protein